MVLDSSVLECEACVNLRNRLRRFHTTLNEDIYTEGLLGEHLILGHGFEQ